MANDGEHHAIQTLFFQLLDSWNKMDAHKYAGFFSEDGNIIGFDGSQANGRKQIEQHISQVFSDHTVATYIGIIREIRFLTPEIGLLRAVAGMVPPGKNDINPKTNAIQTMVAEKKDGQFTIAVYQNTPAAFHGRPELAEQLTNEFRDELRERKQP